MSKPPSAPRGRRGHALSDCIEQSLPFSRPEAESPAPAPTPHVEHWPRWTDIPVDRLVIDDWDLDPDDEEFEEGDDEADPDDRWATSDKGGA